MTTHAQSQADSVECCRICGTSNDLSFEHVPPKSALNRDRVERLTTLDLELLDGASAGLDALLQGLPQEG
jgi:hypothetical protein